MTNGIRYERMAILLTECFARFLRLGFCVCKRQLCFLLLAIGSLAHCSAFALLPFPLGAGQRGIVTCLDNPAISYDIYLPSGYTSNGTALPIVYTFSPNGGGYVNQYSNVCAGLQIIAVGIRGFANGVASETVIREIHAVSRDLRQRVLFDPTVEIMSGFSGGGIISYVTARYRPQQVAAVYDMSGTMGRAQNGRPITDHVQTNLFVARSWGTSDAPANTYAPGDSNFLASCGANVKDWKFSGGHQSSPDSIKTLAFQWIISQAQGTVSQRNASVVQLEIWRTRLANGERQEVMREAINALMTQPRTWLAYQAQNILDELISSGEFLSLDFSNIANGNFAYSHFHFSAYGAALNSDWTTYHASLRALTGVADNRADRSAALSSLLSKNGFPAPLLECTGNSGRINLRCTKTAPELVYTLESRTNLLEGEWREEATPTIETDTSWFTETGVLPGSISKFYRIKAVPAPSGEPYWP